MIAHSFQYYCRSVFANTSKKEKLSITHSIIHDIVWLIAMPYNFFFNANRICKFFCYSYLFIRTTTINV